MASESPLVSFLKNGNLGSLFSNDVVIILGAWPGEPHIIQYKAEHPYMYVITFSIKGVNEVAKYNKPSPSHVEADFNILEYWNNLNEILKDRNVVQIIVDWSTTKFMREDWNFENGNIYNVVKKMLTRAKGSFIFPDDGRFHYEDFLNKKRLFNMEDKSINYPLKNNSFYEVNHEIQKIHIYEWLQENPDDEITKNKIKTFEEEYSEEFKKFLTEKKIAAPGLQKNPDDKITKNQEKYFEEFKKLSTEDKIRVLKSYIDTKKSQKVDTSAEYYEILFS